MTGDGEFNGRAGWKKMSDGGNYNFDCEEQQAKDLEAINCVI
jgi:hypothetical protein